MDAPNGVAVDRRGPLLFLAVVGLALVVVLALAGAGVFGDGQGDEDAWRAAVEQQQGPVSDWEAYREVWVEEICADDDETFAWQVAVAVGQGASFERIETNVSYACPDRADVLDQLRPALTDVAIACGARRQRPDRHQRLLAEALGCRGAGGPFR